MVDDMTDTTGPTLSERARYLAGFKGDKNVLGDVPASLLTDLAAALDAQAALIKELAEELGSVAYLKITNSNGKEVVEDSLFEIRKVVRRVLDRLTKYKAAQP